MSFCYQRKYCMIWCYGNQNDMIHHIKETLSTQYCLPHLFAEVINMVVCTRLTNICLDYPHDYQDPILHSNMDLKPKIVPQRRFKTQFKILQCEAPHHCGPGTCYLFILSNIYPRNLFRLHQCTVSEIVWQDSRTTMLIWCMAPEDWV
jgi:hypothetical protein